VVIQAFGPLCTNYTKPIPKKLPYQAADNTKIVFLGDQGLSSRSAKPVLELVKDWNPDLLVILGDFDYVNSPNSWNALLNSVLGPDFPIIAAAGNHDVPAWNGYQQILQTRLSASGLSSYCTGTPGVDLVCSYKGILFVLNSVGTIGGITSHVTSTEATLSANSDAPWKFCGWHKNQHIYQTGDKSDETGYEILDVCRRYGAVVSTAHEHSYSRTVLMSNFAQATTVSPVQDSYLQLTHGRSFLFVSGLGGQSIRSWKGGSQNNPWWAQCAASNNGVNYGALFCTFKDETEATCQQKDISGTVWDTFTIYSPQTSFNNTEKYCKTPFFEIGASEDVHETKLGEILPFAKTLAMADNTQTIAFKFDDVKISKLDKIRAVHLQVFGYEAKLGEAKITIKAEFTENSKIFTLEKGAISKRKTTISSVVWNESDGEVNEWEEGEVWVSPNLKNLLEEVVSQPGWKEGNSVTLILRGTGPARTIYTRDFNLCMTPTLAIELEPSC